MKLIVAVDCKNGIGKNGTLPWRLREDMEHFRDKTLEVNDKAKRNAVIMGRKCWESIPAKFRPLKDRLNVVVTNTLEEKTEEHLLIRNSIELAVQEVKKEISEGRVENVWNIGGSQVYSYALDKGWVDEIELTKIYSDFDADIHFPDSQLENFEEVNSSEVFEEKGTRFSFHTLKKKTCNSCF